MLYLGFQCPFTVLDIWDINMGSLFVHATPSYLLIYFTDMSKKCNRVYENLKLPKDQLFYDYI
jgi:hypothetical protein